MKHFPMELMMHSSNLGVNTSHVFPLRVNCTLRVCMKWSYLYLVFMVKFSQWPHYSQGVFKTNEAKCTITTYANYTKAPTAVVHEDPASSQLTGRLHEYGFSKPRENFALCTPLYRCNQAIPNSRVKMHLMQTWMMCSWVNPGHTLHTSGDTFVTLIHAPQLRHWLHELLKTFAKCVVNDAGRFTDTHQVNNTPRTIHRDKKSDSRHKKTSEKVVSE